MAFTLIKSYNELVSVLKVSPDRLLLWTLNSGHVVLSINL